MRNIITTLLLLALLLPSASAQFYNAKEYRLVHTNDSTGISNVGIIRWDQATGKFRFWDGSNWFTYGTGGGGGSISLGSINGTTKTANGAAISGSALYMQTADTDYPGLVSTGTQTFAGSKTFSGNLTANGWLNLNSRVPIGTSSFFLANETNGFRVHNSENTAVLLKVTDSGVLAVGSAATHGTDNAWHRLQGVGVDNGSGYFGNYGGLILNATGGYTGDAKRFLLTNAYYGSGFAIIRSVDATTDPALGENGAESSGTTDFAISNTGNVLVYSKLGIGTSSPNAPLQFSNDEANRKIVLFEFADNDHQFVGLGRGAGGELRYQVYTTGTDHAWYAGTSSTTSNELMRLTGEGKLGIGGAPAWPLDVRSATDAIISARNTGSGQVSYRLQRDAGTATTWEMYLAAGTSNLALYNGGDKFTFSAAGTGTATDWVATSDRRLKQNIVDAESQLDKVKDIAKLTRDYELKANGKNETGFIAQELYEVAPEYVVKPDNDSTMWAVNYSKMVVPLYKAVAELTAEVERLRKELNRTK